MPNNRIKPNLGIAWMLLSGVLLIHVIDEAVNDFLQFYNPVIMRLREEIPSFPLPTFSFEGWLTGLLIAIFILSGLSFFAIKKASWIIKLGYVYGIIMLLNGLGHIIGSIFLNRWLPGVYSSPILIIASIYLLWSAANLKYDNKSMTS